MKRKIHLIQPKETKKKQKLKKEKSFTSFLLNLLDFHVIQQIFIELFHTKENLSNREDRNELIKKKSAEIKDYQILFENSSVFSSTCKLFNHVAKNTFFQIKIFQNETIQNITFSAYLKLNSIKQDFIDESFHSNKETILNSMLIYSSQYGFYENIRPLVLNGADINFKEDHSTNLAYSCINGNLKTTKELLKFGSDINGADKLGETALHHACISNNLNLVKYLIKKGSNLYHETNQGETPLFSACSYGNLDIVKYLISLDTKINHNRPNQHTILFSACMSSNLELMQYLLELGLNIDHKNSTGKTCLHLACDNWDLKTGKFLLSKGADFQIKYKGKRNYFGLKFNLKESTKLLTKISNTQTIINTYKFNSLYRKY